MYFNPHCWKAEKISNNKILQCNLCKLKFTDYYFKCSICLVKVHSNCAFRHQKCNYSKLGLKEFENSLLNFETKIGEWFCNNINFIVNNLDKESNNILLLIKKSLLRYKKILICINYDVKSEFFNIGKNLLLKTFYQVIMQN